MHFTNHGVVVRFDFILELGRLSVAAILAKSILRAAVTYVIAAFLVMHSNAVVADIIVSYGGGTVAPGGGGLLDVFVSSNAVSGTPDVLDSFSAHFKIVPLGGAVSNGLQFFDPQGETQLSDSSYVFNGDSLGQIGFVPLGLVSTSGNTNDTYIAGDGTVSGTGFPLDVTSGRRLLFRLNLDASLAHFGDQYAFSLVNDSFTSFSDPSFFALAVRSDSFTPFTITAVPEPATGVFLAVSMAGFGWYHRRRKMKTV